jgi:uncharacterized protein (DUF58 family)
MSQVLPLWNTAYIQRKNLFIWGIALLIPFYLFTPLALVQFICLFFLFVLIGSRLYTEYLIRHIRVIRRDSELRVFRHEWAKVELRLENHGLLPAFSLAVSDTPGPMPVFRNLKTLCTLGRRSWAPFSWQGYCGDRGVFTLGPVIIRGSDPLGLFPFHLAAGETSRLFVYPVFRSIVFKTPGGIPLGNMITANPLYEDITRCRSLRPYQTGDEPRRINWKQSARMAYSGNLMVNEYEATASYPLMVFLNLDRNVYPVKKQADFIERTIEAAAALCLRASRERQEVGIIFYISGAEDGISVIAPSAFSLVPILECLAAVDWTRTANVPADECLRGSVKAMLDQGKRLPYGTRFLYAGPDLGDEAYMNLNSLKKNHLYPEYLIIDERVVPHLVPGNSPRYKMKESGHDII